LVLSWAHIYPSLVGVLGVSDIHVDKAVLTGGAIACGLLAAGAIYSAMICR
jgi:hypothetical protein